MTNKQKHSLKRHFTWVLVATTLLLSCGKRVDLLGTVSTTPPINGLPNVGSCAIGDRLHWKWNQPDATLSHSVDLLFVIDTSLSMLTKRARLAKAIPEFLDHLPAESDVRVGVMLAHGTDRWSGRLYSSEGGPKVIDPKSLPHDDAEKLLREYLTCEAFDLGIGNGEMLLYSLTHGLSDDRFAEAQKQGFFRDQASLSVVFVTDENDPCYDPRAHGYSTFPDVNDSWLGMEKIAYDKYCVDHATGELKITPESTIAALQNRFPGRKITLAGIVHSDPTQVDSWSEDAIGHGIIETVNQTQDGKIMDIMTASYEADLGRLATVTSSQVTLMTLFPLKTDVDTQSLVVSVDGKLIHGAFDSTTQTVQINATDAGGALSQVDIFACPKSSSRFAKLF